MLRVESAEGLVCSSKILTFPLRFRADTSTLFRLLPRSPLLPPHNGAVIVEQTEHGRPSGSRESLFRLPRPQENPTGESHTPPLDVRSSPPHNTTSFSTTIAPFPLRSRQLLSAHCQLHRRHALPRNFYILAPPAHREHSPSCT